MMLTVREFARKLDSALGIKTSRRPRPLNALSSDELLGLMRHETHRIEKAVYNGLLYTRAETYASKRERLGSILHELAARGESMQEPTTRWAQSVHDAFDHLEDDYVRRYSRPAASHGFSQRYRFLEFLASRRSVRVWAKCQPESLDLAQLAEYLIDAARWAPNSGNRQALRYLALTAPAEKGLLEGLKENHCVSAPLLVFVGTDTRLYGAFGPDERCAYLDAGAAIMQMLLAAHACGLGACWNHLSDDLVNSRPSNRLAYATFARHFDIPNYISPVAVVAIGAPAFIPPTPARMSIDAACLRPLCRIDVGVSALLSDNAVGARFTDCARS